MRRSRANNVLIVVSDHTKGLYDDRWESDVLHYTGMGTRGT
jgi:5-methylcytosine-specific restriction enzyme A